MNLRYLKYGSLLAAAALALGTVPAQATVFNLNLTGTIAGFSFSAFNSGVTHYDQASLNLNPFTSFAVAQGDTVNTTLTLNAPITIPASVQYTQVALSFTGPGFAGNTSVTGPTTFFSGVNQVATDTETTLTSAQLVNSALFFPPNNTSLTFDSLTSSFIINTLAASQLLSTATIGYTLASPVPEPVSSSLLLVGLGGLVPLLRRRRT